MSEPDSPSASAPARPPAEPEIVVTPFTAAELASNDPKKSDSLREVTAARKALTRLHPAPESASTSDSAGRQRSVLTLTNVVVHYGLIPAIKGITLHLNQGEIVTIIGANGAGKSTTLRTISGLNRPRHGEIRHLGDLISDLSPEAIVARGIIHCPEGRRIFANLTVNENLDLGAFLRRDPAAIETDRRAVFEMFPRLNERRRQRAGTLSGGEQQMLAIGRALMAKPKVLLLDEPSLGLAPILIQQIMDAIVRLNRETGLTILLVEQNARLALRIAHRAYVLETGSISLAGVAAELASNPDVQKAYLG